MKFNQLMLVIFISLALYASESFIESMAAHAQLTDVLKRKITELQGGKEQDMNDYNSKDAQLNRLINDPDAQPIILKDPELNATVAQIQGKDQQVNAVEEPPVEIK